jgi:hypothetical protein
VQRIDERLQQVQAGADPVDEQQRGPAWAPLPHGNPDLLAVDRDAADRLIARLGRGLA